MADLDRCLVRFGQQIRYILQFGTKSTIECYHFACKQLCSYDAKTPGVAGSFVCVWFVGCENRRSKQIAKLGLLATRTMRSSAKGARVLRVRERKAVGFETYADDRFESRFVGRPRTLKAGLKGRAIKWQQQRRIRGLRDSEFPLK